MSKAALSRAIAAGRLYEVHPGVYSITPPSLMQVDAWHAAAILAGGPGACLCGASAGWWAGIVRQRPAAIHVAVRCDREPRPGIRWHRLRLVPGEIVRHRRMPITDPRRIPLDCAAELSLWELKGVLAELEYHHGIGPHELTLRRGYRGAAKLRKAIAEHTPQLAATRSELERAFIAFLDDKGCDLPDFNVAIGASTVDAVFADQGIVVELDGVDGHSGERRVLRDHRRDLHRRADGLVPLRYHYSQLLHPDDQRLIEAELERFGISRRVR